MTFKFCGRAVDTSDLDIDTALRFVNTLKMLYGRNVAEFAFREIFDVSDLV